LAAARAAAPDAPGERLAPEMIRRVISRMVGDVAAEATRRLSALKPATVADIRAADRPMVVFSEDMARANLGIRDFLFQRMYRHWRVNRTMAKSKRVVQVLFSLLHGGPAMLPPLWRARAGEAGSAKAALVVCDYIAGMTDRFALEEHRRMTDPDISG
jgi:dGTPase